MDVRADTRQISRYRRGVLSVVKQVRQVHEERGVVRIVGCMKKVSVCAHQIDQLWLSLAGLSPPHFVVDFCSGSRGYEVAEDLG